MKDIFKNILIGLFVIICLILFYFSIYGLVFELPHAELAGIAVLIGGIFFLIISSCGLFFSVKFLEPSNKWIRKIIIFSIILIGIILICCER